MFGRRPREKEEHAFVRLIIIPFVVVACVFYRLCDALTVREFYERECVHVVASLYIGDLPFLFVFGAKNILSRALEGCTPHCRILPNFFEKRGFNHQFDVSITRGISPESHTLYYSLVVFAQ